MSPTTVVPFAGRLFLAASVVALVACGGDAAGPEAPNPPGVADTIVFDLQTMDVEVGDTARLGFVARDATGAIVPDVTLTWRSLNPSVATVSADGLITTRGIGEAVIEVEATIPGASPSLVIDSSQVGGTSLKKRVRSSARMIVTPRVSISPRSANAVVHDQTLFTVTVTDQSGQPLNTRPVIRWATSSPSVATIDVTGLTTALSKGTTTIIATVSVGSSLGMTRTATLTVNDDCGGIAEIQTLNGRFIYDYAVGGTIQGGARVGAEYHGNVTSTMTNLGWDPGIPTVVFKGLLQGSASHLEGVFEGAKKIRGIEGSGTPIQGSSVRSEAIVIVELKTCTFRVDVTVSLNLTYTTEGGGSQTLPAFTAGLWIGANKKLSTTGGPLFPIGTDQEYPGHTIAYPFSHENEDAFILYGGYAPQLMRTNGVEPGVGKADVNYSIAVVNP